MRGRSLRLLLRPILSLPSPFHHDEVKMRWVSERECRSERCLSWFIRMISAMETGMAMVVNVHRIHSVLCLV
jgi:hypothetical protein